MSKIKKYSKYGKKILVGASTGIVAGLFLMGVSNTYIADAAEYSEYSASSYSQNTTAPGMHTMRRWNSKSKINSLANSIGLNKDEIQAEIKSGKTLKQILQENGIETSGLGKTFNHRGNKNRMWKK